MALFQHYLYIFCIPCLLFTNVNALLTSSHYISFGLDFCLDLVSDIDECEQGMSDCEQTCQNTVGSYFCECNSGFLLNGDVCEGNTLYLTLIFL